MALTASCPSCGAPVEFKSNSSVFAVCAYCQSTLVRHDQNLEDIGKMAPLVEDRSPLQLGAEGSYEGVHFALIGRIQIKYSQGIWNEWHLLFDDMRTGWLSEAGGEYVLTFMRQVNEPLPAFSGLRIGQRLQVASQVWTVSNLENAACVAGEGELPFKVGAGYPVAAADLRNERHFATLDYSETPPLLFVGEAVDFRSLRLNNLRDGRAEREVSVQAQVFRCPSCASPMQARSPDILAVACASCGTVVDAADPSYKILSRVMRRRDEIRKLRLPLGSKGNLDGKPVEVIGHLVRRARIEGIAYSGNASTGGSAGPGSGVQLLVNFLQLLPGGGQVATGHKVSVFAAQGGHGGGVAGRGCLIIDSCLRLISLRLRCIFCRLRNVVSGCSYRFCIFCRGGGICSQGTKARPQGFGPPGRAVKGCGGLVSKGLGDCTSGPGANADFVSGFFVGCGNGAKGDL